MINQFLNQFNIVIDDDNKVKKCGRDNCKKLINLADSLETNVKHGCIDSGMIDIEKIVALKDKLTHKE